MKTKILIIIAFLTLVQGCTDSSKQNIRNIIVFEDSVESVRDSILVLNSILDNMAEPKNALKNYDFYDRYEISIGDRNFGELEKIPLNTIAVAINSDTVIAKRFISLITFLKRNHLSWGSFWYKYQWFYGYREEGIENLNHHNVRMIVVLNSLNDTSDFKKKGNSHILDIKGKVILCAGADVEIE